MPISIYSPERECDRTSRLRRTPDLCQGYPCNRMARWMPRPVHSRHFGLNDDVARIFDSMSSKRPWCIMNPTPTQPSDVIDQMVALRKQLAQLEAQIEALKPAFFDACAAQAVDQFQHPQAVIYRRLTPGKWNYPSDLIEQVEVRSIGRRR